MQGQGMSPFPHLRVTLTHLFMSAHHFRNYAPEDIPYGKKRAW